MVDRFFSPKLPVLAVCGPSLVTSLWGHRTYVILILILIAPGPPRVEHSARPRGPPAGRRPARGARAAARTRLLLPVLRPPCLSSAGGSRCHRLDLARGKKGEAGMDGKGRAGEAAVSWEERNRGRLSRELVRAASLPAGLLCGVPPLMRSASLPLHGPAPSSHACVHACVRALRARACVRRKAGR